MAVPVDELTHEGVQVVLDIDDVNEYHHTDARRWLFHHDYYDAATWIKNHPLKYSEGLQNGFEVEEDES